MTNRSTPDPRCAVATKINWRHFTLFGGMNTHPAATLRAAGVPTPRSCPQDAGPHLHSEKCISRPTVRGIRSQRRWTASDVDRQKNASVAAASTAVAGVHRQLGKMAMRARNRLRECLLQQLVQQCVCMGWWCCMKQ